MRVRSAPHRCRIALLFGTMSVSASTARAAARPSCGDGGGDGGGGGTRGGGALTLWTPPPLSGLHARNVSYRFDALNTTVELAQHFGEAGVGVGGAQWPAGYVLAEWLSRRPVLGVPNGEVGAEEREPFDWMDVRVCELGAGLGLVSIVAALLGARVTATDGVEAVLPVLRANMEAQSTTHLRHPPVVELLAWGEVRLKPYHCTAP